MSEPQSDKPPMTPQVSLYWQNNGRTLADRRPGKTFQASSGLMCDECCTKMFYCDERHFHRDSCPYCLGTGRNASCLEGASK